MRLDELDLEQFHIFMPFGLMVHLLNEVDILAVKSQLVGLFPTFACPKFTPGVKNLV